MYETDDGVVGVSAIDPTQLLSVVDEEGLDDVALHVRESFERVLDELSE